jgi:HAD superfamily hydrolase (TIGR01484 family)
MDGTLLDSKHRISSNNIEAINLFVNNGGYFTLASGRMTKAIEPYIKYLPVNAPAILYNGSVIYDFNSKKCLWETYLDNKVIELVKKIMYLFPESGIEVYHKNELGSITLLSS